MTDEQIGELLGPTYNKIVVKPDSPIEVSKGGIILPESAKKKSQFAVVVAAGLGRINDQGQRLPMSVKVGDRVLISTQIGLPIEIEGIEYVLTNDIEVLTTIKKDGVTINVLKNVSDAVV
jgi:chaperonin GroES